MRLFGVIKMNRLFLIAVAVICVIVSIVVGATQAVAAASNARKLPVYCVEDEAKIAITFDASWGAERTKGIVDTLCKYGIKATFFLTGIWIDEYPEETKYIAEKGMEIGNHSRHHYNMGKMKVDSIGDEIDYVNRQLAALTGQEPTVFRAPYGDYGNTLIEVLDNKGMKCIQWNVDSLDWKGLGKQELERRILSKTVGGSIILCHNNSEHILEALPTIIEKLSEKYTFVTVSELLDGKTGEIDHTGKLHHD